MADLKGFVLSFLFCLLLQCAPSLQVESMLFVTDLSGNAVFMADLSSDSLDSLTFDALPFSSVFQPYSVDYDPDTRMVYWSEIDGPIRRANIDGTMQSVIVDKNSAPNPYFIALDTSRGKIFWIDAGLDQIMSANLDGSSQQIIIDTDLYGPNSIIIHKGEGVMFWTDISIPSRIERASLDGGDRTAIVIYGITYPRALAFDADCSRVYWGDEGTDTIESVDLWGNDRMVHLATSMILPWDIAVVDDSIIWADKKYNAIGVTSTNSSSGYSLYYQNIFRNPRGIHLYQDIDDCSPAPCLNGGTCADEVNGYTCTCLVGYTGLTCETDIDDCSTAPCLNGGTCADEVNGYTCTCVVGYTGLTCETDIDDCSPAPCLNGGTCADKVNGYTCTCVVGYTGLTCETDIDDCSPAPCLNGGTCADEVNGYTCTCVVGYTGLTCETDIDDCSPAPCLNGGTCADEVNDYTCTCVVGYTGLTCETEEMPTTTEVYTPTTDQANTVRLVNGTETHEGRVEVFHNGSWGTVCDDYWGIEDARVVCRSIGYRDALSAPSQARFGQGSGPIWMDDVNCSGIEAHIFDCPQNGFGNHDCNHGEDASVVCLPDQADLTCDSVSMTLIMERTLLEIGDDARDVHFEDESCVAYDHDSEHVAITSMYDRCGTTQEQDDDYIIFTNMVTYYKPRPENGTNELIAREHYLKIPVTCYLERTQVLEESFLPEANLYVFEEVGYGDFSLNLDRYTSPGFYQPANDSGEVTLGTPLYFGVRLTSVTNLTLLIESCWATSSPDPRDIHRYDIIENGCAVDKTTVIFNWASPTFKGFSIDAFTFIGDYDKVYVHCSILICDNNDSGSPCAQGCLARSRRSLQPTGSRSKPHTITNGPLSDASRSQRPRLLDTIDDGLESHDPLMIVGVSALCVLIALTVVNALMKMRMRRPRPEQIGYRRVGVTEQD